VRPHHEALNDYGARSGAAVKGIPQQLIVPRSRNGHGPRLVVKLIHKRLGSPFRVPDDGFCIFHPCNLGKDLLVRDVLSSLDPAHKRKKSGRVSDEKRNKRLVITGEMPGNMDGSDSTGCGGTRRS
jgi:hypothetical protein